VTSKTHGWKYDKPLDQGKSVSLVFHKAGTYTYYCKIHPDMVAKIIVKK
jgi:plastocyanin